MTVINTNIKSLIAADALKVNSRAMSKAMNQLSTGSRINSAADDAAGLAISQSMTSQIRGMNMAVRNANDGISLAQTAEGAMVEVSNMLQRMRELSVQAESATLDISAGVSKQRNYLDSEFQALATQVTKIVSDTKWNGSKMFDGKTFDIQVSADSGKITVDPSGGSATGPDLDLSTSTGTALKSDIKTVAAATSAKTNIDTALDTVNNIRAGLGATVNQLTFTADNLSNQARNLSESRSRILDTDYAAATTELARTQIIQQAGTAVLAQANQQPQSVLALLR